MQVTGFRGANWSFMLVLGLNFLKLNISTGLRLPNRQGDESYQKSPKNRRDIQPLAFSFSGALSKPTTRGSTSIDQKTKNARGNSCHENTIFLEIKNFNFQKNTSTSIKQAFGVFRAFTKHKDVVRRQLIIGKQKRQRKLSSKNFERLKSLNF